MTNPADRTITTTLRVSPDEKALIAATAAELHTSLNTAACVLIDRGSLFPLDPDSVAIVTEAAAVLGGSPRATVAELLRTGWRTLRAAATPPPTGTQTTILDPDQ